MAHEVEFRIPSKVSLGRSDVVFRAYDDEGLIGTLMVSQGGVEWRSARRQYVMSSRWHRFDEIAATGFPRARKKPTRRTQLSRKRTTPRRRRTTR